METSVTFSDLEVDKEYAVWVESVSNDNFTSGKSSVVTQTAKSNGMF